MASTSPYSSTLLSIATLYLIMSGAASASERCHPHDKKALLQIKKSLNNPSLLSSWTPSSDCCDHWYTVTCDDNSHRVSLLTVQNDNFPGSIPAAVGNLPYLTELTLRKLPNLTGPIPNSIANLHNLETLSLDWNALTGPIPSFLHTLNKLTQVDLSYNKLSGSIPASLILAPGLIFLRLDRNQLTGSIPDTFSSIKLRPWYALYLSHNQLSGPIPASLGRFNFTILDLSRNNLTGDASFLLRRENPMIGFEVDLSRNELAFDLSKIELPPRIGSLLLDHNKIYGSLPPSLTKLIYMTSFNVSYNRLCGPIPTGGRLGEYGKYSFYHNKCLCGAPLDPCT